MKLRVVFGLLSIFAFQKGVSQTIQFVENKTQWADEIHYGVRVGKGNMFVRPGGFTYSFLDQKKLYDLHEKTHGPNESSLSNELEVVDGEIISVDFIGSNHESQPSPSSKISTYYNFFKGNDQSRWAAHVNAYSSVSYTSFYKGIDLKLYSSGDFVKYDFIVAPEADPSTIQFRYTGNQQISLSQGSVHIKGNYVSIFENTPEAYQIINGKKVNVPCEYTLSENNVIGFRFPEGYDSRVQLTIDPLLIFSTYSGSNADNWGSTATPGEHGKLYSSGITNEWHGTSLQGTFPATAGAFQTTYGGAYDVAVLKYDSLGHTLLYASFLGGTRSDTPHSLVMNRNNELLVLGTTSSSDFPTSATAFDRTFHGGAPDEGVISYEVGVDIFITRLSSDGTQLLSSTYLGGSGNDGINPSFSELNRNYGDAQRGDIIADVDGSILISTVSSSTDLPVRNSFGLVYNGGLTDGIIFKFKADLSDIVWGAYIGGNSTDASHSIKIDQADNIFVGGGTTSNNFPSTTGVYQPTHAGAVDGWIAKVANNGSSILAATYTGTPGYNQVYFLDLNSNNQVYVYGQTQAGFPVTSNVYSNPNGGQFIQKFSNDLTTLIFSTTIGSGRGIPDISPTAFLVNDCNNIYLSGWGGLLNNSSQFWPGSSTRNLPLTSDAFKRTTNGSDFYFMVLTDNARQFVYGTYFGGNQSLTHVDGGTSRFDKNGIVYHAVCAGCVSGNITGGPTSDFPTTPGAWSRTNNSRNCNNAAFKFDLSLLRAVIQTNSVRLNSPGLNRVCMPDKIVFQNFSIGANSFQWRLGDGTNINKVDTSAITHQYRQPGRYTVWLKAFNPGTCLVVDSTSVVVDVFAAQGQASSDQSICIGTSTTISATGGGTYLWTTADGSFTSNAQAPMVSPATNTTYFVSIVDVNGCTSKDTLKVKVVPLMDVAIQTNSINLKSPGLDRVCIPDKIVFQNRSIGGTRFLWRLGDGIEVIRNDTSSVTHQYQSPGVYTVWLKGLDAGSCRIRDSISTVIRVFVPAGRAGNDVSICEGSPTTLSATGGAGYSWTVTDGSFSSSSQNPIVSPVKTTTYLVSITDANTCVVKDEIVVRVVPRVNVDVRISRLFYCDSRVQARVENLTNGSESSFIDFGDGTVSQAKLETHAYEKDGIYNIRVIGQREFCTYEKGATLGFYNVVAPNVITPDTSPGYNDTFDMKYGTELLSTLEAMVTFRVFDRWGNKVFEDTNYKGTWGASGLTAGVYFYEVAVDGESVCKSWIQIVK